MPPSEPRVTVIVLNYNGKTYVEPCLNSLFRNNYLNFEVLFIDNDSPDKSAEIAARLFHYEPRFKLIRNKKNLGFSAGNNLGFKVASAKYVIVLNNDTQVEEKFIEIMVRTAEMDEKIGSVGCKIVQLDGRILYGPQYMNYGFIIHAFHKSTYEKSTTVLANCGCATLFRKSLVDRIGGFDPYLWTDWEDHDLGYRINSAGYKCTYTPETTVLHLGGGNYLGVSRERQIRIIRNKLFVYVKNYQAINLVFRVPLIWIKGLLTYVKNKEATTFLKGTKESLSIWPVIQERKRILKNRNTSDKEIFEACRIPENVTFLQTMKNM